MSRLWPTSWPILCLDCAWIISQTARPNLWPFLSTNKRVSKRKFCRTLIRVKTHVVINFDIFKIHLYWNHLSRLVLFVGWGPPIIDGKGPRSWQQALKSQFLTFIQYLRMCFRTWDNLYVLNSAKSDGAFPLIFRTKMFVGYALTPSLTSSADSWHQFRESNARSSVSEWNRMKPIPDLHVFVSWPFLFVETGNCKPITANKQNNLGKSVHIYHRITGYIHES